MKSITILDDMFTIKHAIEDRKVGSREAENRIICLPFELFLIILQK